MTPRSVPVVTEGLPRDYEGVLLATEVVQELLKRWCLRDFNVLKLQRSLKEFREPPKWLKGFQGSLKMFYWPLKGFDWLLKELKGS